MKQITLLQDRQSNTFPEQFLYKPINIFDTRDLIDPQDTQRFDTSLAKQFKLIWLWVTLTRKFQDKHCFHFRIIFVECMNAC